MREERLLFTAEAVATVPEVTGAYVLFREQHPLYAGIAAGGATLRSELAAHLHATRRDGHVTHFSWQAAANALDAYRLQLTAYAHWRCEWMRPA
jgi:hypothetical protein